MGDDHNHDRKPQAARRGKYPRQGRKRAQVVCSLADLAVIDAAAAIVGQDRSTFMREAAIERAHRLPLASTDAISLLVGGAVLGALGPMLGVTDRAAVASALASVIHSRAVDAEPNRERDPRDVTSRTQSAAAEAKYIRAKLGRLRDLKIERGKLSQSQRAETLRMLRRLRDLSRNGE